MSGARAGILVPRGPVMSNLSFLTEVRMHHRGGIGGARSVEEVPITTM